MCNPHEQKTLRSEIKKALRDYSINASNVVLRILDEYAVRNQKHLRMGKVKIGDFVQVNGGPVVPIGMNGVIVLEVDDAQPDKPEKG